MVLMFDASHDIMMVLGVGAILLDGMDDRWPMASRKFESNKSEDSSDHKAFSTWRHALFGSQRKPSQLTTTKTSVTFAPWTTKDKDSQNSCSIGSS